MLDGFPVDTRLISCGLFHGFSVGLQLPLCRFPFGLLGMFGGFSVYARRMFCWCCSTDVRWVCNASPVGVPQIFFECSMNFGWVFSGWSVDFLRSCLIDVQVTVDWFSAAFSMAIRWICNCFPVEFLWICFLMFNGCSVDHRWMFS